MGSQPLPDLFTSLQVPHFGAAISCDRLKLNYQFCRFDNIDPREERQVRDKFCHVRKLRDKFIEQSQSLYDLGPNATIDEMLLKFRGQCSFRQYIPSKPGRYGIKFWILADAENHYYSNAFPYLCKERDKIVKNLGATVVKKLVEPILNTSRNITCDRYFTGVELFEHLLKVKLTSDGTIMSNRKHLPIPLTIKGNREINSTLFAFKDSVIMCSWVPKKGKLVLLLSILHQTNCTKWKI